MEQLSQAVRPRRVWVSVAAASVTVIVLLALLACVAALTFSVRVEGASMEPTLRSGDRLVADFISRGSVARFDLVDAVEPDLLGKPGSGGAHIVKRVIGLPGDQIAVRGGVPPQVFVRPQGARETFVVDNPTWRGRTAGATGSCCLPGGGALPSGLPLRWVTVPAGTYWVIGDNWGGSTDSRAFGFVPKANVKARLEFRILPLGRFGWLRTQAHLAPVRVN